MAVNNKGTNQAAIIISGLAIVIGAVIIYLYILNGVFGRFDADELIPKVKILRSSLFENKKVVGILFSKYTENMLSDGNTWVRDNIKTWEKFLNNTNLSYEIIDDETIESGKHFKYDLIILPGSKSLSDREIIELKKFIYKGGSIFATGGTASFSDDGKWRGWDFLSEVFGAKFTKEIKNENESNFHILRGGLPLTANIPTGFPLKVAAWDRPMAVEVLDPRTTQVSFWYNYKNASGLIREEIKKSAGIINGTYGNGRFVWLGFEINSVVGVQQDYVYFERFFNNCVNWLTYGPIAFVKDWPNGFDAAALIATDFSTGSDDIDSLVKILKAENVNADFFIDPSNFKQNFLKKLSQNGKIYPILKFNINQSDSLNSQGYKSNLEEIKKIKKSLQNKLNQDISGAYVKSKVNLITNDLLSNAGYKFFLSDSISDRLVPKIFSTKKNEHSHALRHNITVLPFTARDDKYVIHELGLEDPGYQFYTYQEDIDRTLFGGGLYIFKTQQNYQLKPKNISVIKKVIEDIKNKNIWLTTAEELSDWYSKRGNIEIKVDRRGKRRVAVNITNLGKDIVDGLIINVDLNDKASNLNVTEEIIGTEPAKYKYYEDKRIVFFHVNSLKSEESRTYYIDYDRPNT